MFYEDDRQRMHHKPGRSPEPRSANPGPRGGPGQLPNHGRASELDRWLTALGLDRDLASDAQGSNPPVALTQTPAKESQTLAAALLEEASFQLLAYLRAERERYLAQGRGLNEAARALFGRFFSQELLSKVLVVVLSGQRLTNPAADAQTSGLAVINLPDLTHQASATFLDVIVFNDHITDRELFHALVQAAQAQLMGARCYAELFVRGVLQARSYALAPLQAQAFALGARFASHPEVPFSVEDEIRAWLSAGRY